MENFQEELKRRGFKITSQRKLILTVLSESHTHLSPEEIFLRVKKRFPRIGQATVYRNLELMSRVGIIRKADWGERHLHYELGGENHYHILCTRCGKVVEFMADIFQLVREKLAEKYRFAITHEDIRFSGFCETCQQTIKGDIHGY